MIYLYTTANGKMTVEENFPMGKAPKKIVLPVGLTAYRDVAAEHRKGGGEDGRAVNPYPLKSTAVGVQPKQRFKAMKHAAEIGVPTTFDKRGDAVFESRGHRKRYCEAIGSYDLNGGYSDPQRK